MVLTFVRSRGGGLSDTTCNRINDSSERDNLELSRLLIDKRFQKRLDQSPQKNVRRPVLRVDSDGPIAAFWHRLTTGLTRTEKENSGTKSIGTGGGGGARANPAQSPG